MRGLDVNIITNFEFQFIADHHGSVKRFQVPRSTKR
jgi:hypothetical protein